MVKITSEVQSLKNISNSLSVYNSLSAAIHFHMIRPLYVLLLLKMAPQKCNSIYNSKKKVNWIFVNFEHLAQHWHHEINLWILGNVAGLIWKKKCKTVKKFLHHRIIFFVNLTRWNKLKALVWHLVLYELEGQPLNRSYQHVVELGHFRQTRGPIIYFIEGRSPSRPKRRFSVLHLIRCLNWTFSWRKSSVKALV